MTTDDGTRQTPLLALIDLQQVFADPASPWAAPRFPEITAPVTRLLAGFATDDAVFTRFVAPREPAGAWRAYFRQWPFALRGPDDPLYALVAEFAGDAARRRTVDMTTFGKWGPPLAQLISPGRGLVLAGVATDCCVISTALAAADAGVAVTVALDACAGADDDAHGRAASIMASYAPLISVVTVDDVLEGLSQAPAG